MTLKETVRNSLLSFPVLYFNALTVYNHLFCTIGNGYEWVKGELVEDGVLLGKSKPKKLTIEKAAIRAITESERRKDKEKIYGENWRLELVLPEIEEIFLVDKKMGDFSIPSEQNSRPAFNWKYILKSRKEDFKFYPLSKHSKMCCLPDDIKPDWLRGVEKLVGIMETNPDRVRDLEGWLLKVKSRIKELKNEKE